MTIVNFWRAAMTLVLMMLTASTAWAQTEETYYNVYVNDEVSGETTLVDFTKNKEQYAEGETVTLNVALAQGVTLQSVTASTMPGGFPGATVLPTSITVTKVDDMQYTFKMPADNVRVSYDYYVDNGTHHINWTGSNGTMQAKVDNIYVISANEGNEVTIILSNDANKQAVNVTVTGATSGNAVTVSYGGWNTYTFQMPAEAVNVIADFKYGLQMMTDGHSTTEATVGNNVVTAADENDQVTLTVTPDEGYAVAQIIVGYTNTYESVFVEVTKTDATHYTFLMPAATVTILPSTAFVLADNADNSTIISTNNDKDLTVMLQGRKLYKDGGWNTLCLPFDLKESDLNASQGCMAAIGSSKPLVGATVMVLDVEGTYDNEGHASASGANSTGFDVNSGTVSLYFKTPEANANDVVIAAGTPFIIKWEGSSGTIDNPVFSSVYIKNASTEVAFTNGKFVGTYGPIEWTSKETGIIFLGANNQLYYPQPSGDNTPSINAFRAYFDLGTYSARQFVLHFGDGEQTGIHEITDPTPAWEGSGCTWYDMSGRRLSGMPTRSGIYVNKGRKIIIK